MAALFFTHLVFSNDCRINAFSNSVKAHPLEIFIVILLGAQINGIVGMVLAIPVYTAIRVIAKEFLSEFKIVQQITRRMNEED